TSPRMTGWGSVTLRRVVDLPGILDHLDLAAVDVDELAVSLLDAADIDVLDHVPLVRIDHDRAARTVELLALHEVDILGAVGVGTELGYRLIDQSCPVPGGDRGNIRHCLVAEHLHELLLE